MEIFWQIFVSAFLILFIASIVLTAVYTFFQSIVLSALKQHSIWKADGSMLRDMEKARKTAEERQNYEKQRREAKIKKLQAKNLT